MGFGGVNGAISISKCCKLLVVVIKFTNASGLYISQNTFSMGPFKYYFSMFFAHVSIWPPPSDHLFADIILEWPLFKIQKSRNDNGQSVSFFSCKILVAYQNSTHDFSLMVSYFALTLS